MSEEHPFEVACKLARSLYDRRQAAAARAEQVLREYYNPKFGTRTASHVPATWFRQKAGGGMSSSERVFQSFNGQPRTVGEIKAQFPEIENISTVLFKLVAEAHVLRRVKHGVYERINRDLIK